MEKEKEVMQRKRRIKRRIKKMNWRVLFWKEGMKRMGMMGVSRVPRIARAIRSIRGVLLIRSMLMARTDTGEIIRDIEDRKGIPTEGLTIRIVVIDSLVYLVLFVAYRRIIVSCI